jgi:hypothetical protein
VGARSKIGGLPPEVLEALDARLIGGGFRDYRGQVEWLAEQGFEISLSSLHRHGSGLEAELEEAIQDARRTRALARAMKEENEEADGSLLAAASEIMQDKLVQVSLKLGRGEAEDDPAETAKTLSLVSRAFSDVGRFEIQRQKWQAEVRTKLDALEKESQKPGATLDAATLKAVKEALYG